MPKATDSMVAEKIRRHDAFLDLWTGEPLTLEELSERQAEENSAVIDTNASDIHI